MKANTRTAQRLRPHKIWDDDGVASTVGTIMAMMVFLAALSMFTSQYVPVWMEENEASHMSAAYGQFAALKQAVDMQILAGTIQGSSPVQMFSPVKLGAEGIPMFAAPTPGYLSVYRSDSYNNVSFSFNTSAAVLNHTANAGGTIKLYVPNRYFIPQTLAYEGDTLILKQSDGEYMKAMPQFIVTRIGLDSYTISYTQVDLRGDDSNYVGFGTRGIQTTLRAVTTTTFNNLTDEIGPGNPAKNPYLYFNQTTWYERAWNSSFNQTLSAAGMVYGTPAQLAAGTVDYTIVSTLRPNNDPIDDFYEVSVRINPNVVSRFTLTVAYVEVSTAEMGAA
ncbi:MAG: hypothetical protein KKH41_07210 [Candidatus Thermoplasmatota archaeon]|nr:hypothetical protein [Euryarchaeota archaeon]MBU4031368.1 hypothetical protein [Candidatus Thermoplasmatota archaeon]MBU4071338.1 hypothetical protein [Candidatus Thermoplasmatota archaeon]MBU4143340.1 hypothetical protein [Candidatus Thermoplasmatota archaeon]MBU4592355.1 hypothetical protein [Candidatus Thermoplasmatota archaeon]